MIGKGVYVIFALFFVQPALFYGDIPTVVSDFSESILQKEQSELQFASGVAETFSALSAEHTRFNKFLLDEATAIREATLKDLCLKVPVKPPYAITTSLNSALQCWIKNLEAEHELYKNIIERFLQIGGLLRIPILFKFQEIQELGDIYSPLIMIDLIRVSLNVVGRVITALSDFKNGITIGLDGFFGCVDTNIQRLGSQTETTVAILKNKC